MSDKNRPAKSLAEEGGATGPVSVDGAAAQDPPVANGGSGAALGTPEYWAAECGHAKVRLKRGLGQSDPGTPGFSARHLAAAQAHGWDEHRKHTTETLRMSRDVYLAALEAAGRGETHQPAMSPVARQARSIRAASEVTK